jgi:hypothetical protein
MILGISGRDQTQRTTNLLASRELWQKTNGCNARCIPHPNYEAWFARADTCFPISTTSGVSFSDTLARILATLRGVRCPSCSTCIPRSAPIANAVRIVSAVVLPPIETATTSFTTPWQKEERVRGMRPGR